MQFEPGLLATGKTSGREQIISEETTAVQYPGQPHLFDPDIRIRKTSIHSNAIQKEKRRPLRGANKESVQGPSLVILLLLPALPSTTLPPCRQPRPLLRLGRDPLPALRVPLLLLPRRPPPEPRLGLAGLQPLDLAAALKQVPDHRRVGLPSAATTTCRGRRLEVEQLVPQVKLLGVRREQALEERAPLLAVTVGRAELERRELGEERRVNVRRVAAVAGVAEHLRGALEEGARAVGLVGGRVEEVGVVVPDVRGGEAVLLEDLFEEIVGFLWRMVSTRASWRRCCRLGS